MRALENDVWLYEGPPDEIGLSVPDASPEQGGYVIVCELQNSELRMFATRFPTKCVNNWNSRSDRFAGQKLRHVMVSVTDFARIIRNDQVCYLGLDSLADATVGSVSKFEATTVLAMLHWLGIDPSYSRPRVSNDNPYVESLFRTAKYRPEFPAGGFVDLDHARGWATEFVRWYNHAHRHSGIGYVTPAQRHAGTDRHILQARHELYLRARQSNPGRWSGETRNWRRIDVVALNPEREATVCAGELPGGNKERLAA